MRVSTQVNWSMYYQQFVRQHGGEPVLYLADKETGRGGYLLFRDGWMYSRSDPSGPEMPPISPEDTIKKSRDYWFIRRSVFREEINRLKDDIMGLARLQERRSASLMAFQVVVTEDENGNRTRKRQAEPVDFELLLNRLRDLDYLVDECDAQLKSLKDGELPPTPERIVSVAVIQAEIEEILGDSDGTV